MAKIKPFRAIRPAKGLEQRIAALPYDVYNRQEAREEVEREPLSFLKIDRAETLLPEGTDIYSPEVYEKAKQVLWDMVADGQFIREETACYYLYELTMAGRVQTGITAVASVDDYLNQVIKKHENTREEKEQDRIRHVQTCEAQTGPIFLAYRRQAALDELVEQAKEREPLYDFCSVDGIRHRVWKIEDASSLFRIEEAFKNIGEIYIADGHHRCASAVKVALQKRAENPTYTGKEAYHYFLAVLFPDEQLEILDYNRAVKDLNGLSREDFLEKVKERFFLEEMGREPYHPEKKGTFGMFLEDTWYRLTVRDAYRKEDPVEGLDVAVLQDALLAPILGIGDARTDKRIDFIGGIRGLGELERRVHTDCAVAFSMYPTSIQELFAVADAGRLMPPKSTWFEPKLRSGLFVHSIKEE